MEIAAEELKVFRVIVDMDNVERDQAAWCFEEGDLTVRYRVVTELLDDVEGDFS